MRKTFILLTLGILAIVTVPVVALADDKQATGFAQMHSADGSGINGIITFQDNGTDLFVRGNATGMDTREEYLSLVYDTGSVLAGDRSCRPGEGPEIDMEVGIWAVDIDGNGELDVKKEIYEPLKKIRTISIRRETGARDELVACGVVVVHKIKKK